MILLQNRLGTYQAEWSKIGTSTTVLDWIRDGVPIPFKKTPCHTRLCNPKFSKVHYEFLQKELSRLLIAGAIEKCTHKPYFISPLNVVPKKDNKFRLITNLKELNTYVDLKTFKQEDVRTCMDLINPGDEMVTLDIQDCFFHFRVHPSVRDYLAFTFAGQTYRWAVLPFGLCISPYYCAKIMRPIVTFLRDYHSMRCQVYVDDWILFSQPKSMDIDKENLLQTLQDLGLLINYKKSNLISTTEISYIGFMLNSTGESGFPELWITPTRVKTLIKSIKQLLKLTYASARAIARVLGQCVSTTFAISYGKTMLRGAYNVLRSRDDWESLLFLDSPLRTDLNWWLCEMYGTRRKHIVKRFPECILTTDASEIGYGASLTFHDNQKELCTSGQWNVRMSYTPSNVRELTAIFLAMNTFQEHLKNKTVLIRTDNITSRAYIIHQGGPVCHLNWISRAIWSLAAKINLNIQVVFLRGCLNTKADLLSRIVDNYNYRLNPRIFKWLNTILGPFSVDRFADCINRQLPIYNSLYYDPETSGINCFDQNNWAIHNNYCLPPFHLIGRLLDTIVEQKALATVIAPRWTGQTWFKKLQQMTVCPPIQIPNTKYTFTRMSRFVIPETWNNFKWNLFAWKVHGALG